MALSPQCPYRAKTMALSPYDPTVRTLCLYDTLSPYHPVVLTLCIYGPTTLPTMLTLCPHALSPYRPITLSLWPYHPITLPPYHPLWSYHAAGGRQAVGYGHQLVGTFKVRGL